MWFVVFDSFIIVGYWGISIVSDFKFDQFGWIKGCKFDQIK